MRLIQATAAAAALTAGLVLLVHSAPSGSSSTPAAFPGAGALKITDAPRGLKAARAPGRAELRFTSKNGVTGTLHLRDDTVTLD